MRPATRPHIELYRSWMEDRGLAAFYRWLQIEELSEDDEEAFAAALDS